MGGGGGYAVGWGGGVGRGLHCEELHSERHSRVNI